MQSKFTTSNILRFLHNLLKVGTVAQTQDNPPRVRVQCGELLTDWLPWFNLRAGFVKTAFVPSIGEQCLVLSPGGNLAAGMVLLGLNSDQNPPPDCAPNDLIIQVPAGGRLLLQCGASMIELTESNLTLTATRIDHNKA